MMTPTHLRDIMIAGMQEHGCRFALRIINDWAQRQPCNKDLPDPAARQLLIEALRECVSRKSDAPPCVANTKEYMQRRLDYITQVAKDAIEEAA